MKKSNNWFLVVIGVGLAEPYLVHGDTRLVEVLLEEGCTPEPNACVSREWYLLNLLLIINAIFLSMNVIFYC